jgi:nucleobase:cation symporter-1, NCS1 family
VVELARSGWRIEQKGIDWIGDSERHGRASSLFWPWTAANFSFFTVAYGVFVVGLGLHPWQGALAVVIGLGLSYPMVGMVALAGTRGGAPTMTLSRAPFGHHGNKLPTFFVYLSLVGWETVSVTLGALATRTILERVSPGLGATPMLVTGFLITAALVMVIAIYGYDVIMRVQRWITLAVAVAVAGYFVIILPKLDFTGTTGTGSLALVIGGITLVIANASAGRPAARTTAATPTGATRRSR